MKCGTTSLHGYLDQHPAIAMSRVKEIDFFIGGDYERGLEWYAEHFDPAAPIRGESSTSYTKYPQRPHAPERMSAALPDVRLVYLVRDPVERTVSHYTHARHRRRERRSLREALAILEDNTYVDPSRYAMQLERYLRHFRADQILVVESESLRDDAIQTLDTIRRFLGVDPHAFDTTGKANVSEQRGVARPMVGLLESYRLKRLGRRLPRSLVAPAKAINAMLSRRESRPRLDEETRARLADHLAPDVARLRELTGQPFASWSI